MKLSQKVRHHVFSEIQCMLVYDDDNDDNNDDDMNNLKRVKRLQR